MDNVEKNMITEEQQKERATQLDNLPWRDSVDNKSEWIKADFAPKWLFNILRNEKCYTFAGYYYEISGSDLYWLMRRPERKSSEVKEEVGRQH